MCKVVCAMGFGPIGFMASFVSCDETSVHICERATVESTGCIYVSCVLGEAQAVYILDRLCAMSWYMSCEHSSLSSFSKHFSPEVYVLRRPCDETAVQECVRIYKSVCTCEQAALVLLEAHMTLRPDAAGRCERAGSPCTAA